MGKKCVNVEKNEEISGFGRVRELLINSEKASASPIFEENVERFSCIRFSITHGHDRGFNDKKTLNRLGLKNKE